MQIKQFITITITTPTTATTATTPTTPTTDNTATAATRASTPSTYSTRTASALQVLARHCGLVVYMAFSHEVLAIYCTDLAANR